jgi:type I restriction enzyme S subunit
MSTLAETESKVRRVVPTAPWPIVRLGDVAKTASGGTPKRTVTAYYGGGIPWVKSGELGDSTVYKTSETISKAGLNESSAKLFPKGTLCVALYGATIGKLGILGMEAATNQAVCGIFLPPEIDTRFAYRFLESNRRQLIGSAKGGAQPNISQEIIREIQFPLPPLNQQRWIVAEIEKQFTRLDAGLVALSRMQANLKRYRAAVLKAACEGRLIPTEAELARIEHRKYEPANELIARTPTPPRPNRWNSRSNAVILGHPALAVGNPGTRIPEGWAWSALVEIAKMESGHTPSRNHPEWWDGDIAWIGIADAREHDGRTIHETFQHTNSDGIANSASRLLPAGTVCISRTASVGYVVVMGREMATSQDFVNWIPTAAVASGWLRIIFSTDREALRRFGKGSVHNTIYFPEWISVHIAVPPLAEQERIVAEVERRLSVIDDLAALVQTNLQRASRLCQSILQQAFRGESWVG